MMKTDPSNVAAALAAQNKQNRLKAMRTTLNYAIGAPIQTNFKKNRLSVDPLVFPSSKIEAVSQV